MTTSQSLGGQATAKKLRRQALGSYYASPNYCKHCDKLIRIPSGGKVQATRRKKFCNRSCAAKHNNWKFPKRKAAPKSPRKKRLHVSERSKGEISGPYLRTHAREVYDGPRSCKVCHYALHVDICHIRPVADFPGNTLISEINCPSNLVALCPTHHWEFDNGHLVF